MEEQILKTEEIPQEELQLNGKCKGCNGTMGLKQCPRCRTILPKFWFYRGQSACKGCRKNLRVEASQPMVRSSKAKPRRGRQQG